MTSPNILNPAFVGIMIYPELAARIPKIKTLRKQLDYGDEARWRVQAFCDDIRVFRKSFETTGGVQGHKLYEWRSKDDRLGLSEMTLEYLEARGNGAKFWPDDRRSYFYNKWQYSTHHEFIKQTVLRLIWRMNLQQQRNDKHKSKRKAAEEEQQEAEDSEEVLEEGDDLRRSWQEASGQNVPIDSTFSNANAATASSTTRCSPPVQSNTSGPPKYTKSTFQAVCDDCIARAAPEPTMRFEPSVDGQSQTSDASASQRQNDNYAEPPIFQHSAAPGGRPIFRDLPQDCSPADGKQSAHEFSDERQAKRTKFRHGSGTEPTEYARKKPGPLKTYKPVKRRRGDAVALRWSNRQRKERQLFGAASPEQLEQLDEHLLISSEDDQAGVDNGSGVQRKREGKPNTEADVASGSMRTLPTKTSEVTAPGTLRQDPNTELPTQIREAERIQQQRTPMPPSTSVDQTTERTTSTELPLDTIAIPSRQAAGTRAAQPREEARDSLPQCLPVSVPAHDGPLRGAPPPPQSPHAMASAGQTLPQLDTGSTPLETVPAGEAPMSAAPEVPPTELVDDPLGQTVQHKEHGVRPHDRNDDVDSARRHVSPFSPFRGYSRTPPRISRGTESEMNDNQELSGRIPREKPQVLPSREHACTSSSKARAPQTAVPEPDNFITLGQIPHQDSTMPSREFGGVDTHRLGQEEDRGMTPPYESPRPSTVHLHARCESVLDEEFGGFSASIERNFSGREDAEVRDEELKAPTSHPGSSEVKSPALADSQTALFTKECAAPPSGNEADESPAKSQTARSMKECAAPPSEDEAVESPDQSSTEHTPWLSFNRAVTEPPRAWQESRKLSREDPRFAAIKIVANTVPPQTIHKVNAASRPQPMDGHGSMGPPQRPSREVHSREGVGDFEAMAKSEVGETSGFIAEQKRETSTPKPRPNIRVLYSVILSRNPVLQCRDWKPNGAFRDKTWSQLKEEIPLTLGADTKGLLFSLTGPRLSTQVVVLHDEDEEFEVVKRRFERMIRACVPKGVAGGEPPIFEMEIEALTDESTAAAAVEMYEEAFAW